MVAHLAMLVFLPEERRNNPVLENVAAVRNTVIVELLAWLVRIEHTSLANQVGQDGQGWSEPLNQPNVS